MSIILIGVLAFAGVFVLYTLVYAGTSAFYAAKFNALRRHAERLRATQRNRQKGAL